MRKIITSIRKDVVAKSIQRARERKVILPQFAQQKDPSKIPAKIVDKLKGIGLWQGLAALASRDESISNLVLAFAEE